MLSLSSYSVNHPFHERVKLVYFVSLPVARICFDFFLFLYVLIDGSYCVTESFCDYLRFSFSLSTKRKDLHPCALTTGWFVVVKVFVCVFGFSVYCGTKVGS